MLSLETPHFNKMGDIDDDNDDSIDDTEYQNALGTRPDLPDYLDDFLQDDAYEKILGRIYVKVLSNAIQKCYFFTPPPNNTDSVMFIGFRFIFCLYIRRSNQ